MGTPGAKREWGEREPSKHIYTDVQRGRGGEMRWRKGDKTEKGKGGRDRGEGHMLTQGAQTERWRSGDVGGRQRKMETGSWREGREAV